jgi:hypothetical protein
MFPDGDSNEEHRKEILRQLRIMKREMQFRRIGCRRRYERYQEFGVNRTMAKSA